jgi:hypothetical protein
MKRRTLDIAFSIGGALFAVLLLVLGLVLKDQADFAKSYVKDQLSLQKITFTPEAGLNGEQDDAPCLINYAGTNLDSGKKAECYANEYIAFHLAEAAKGAGYEGETYATLGTPQRELRTELQTATDAGQDTADIQAKLDAVNGLRDTMFKGETLRGLLLTTFGFSIFGERADTAALVAFLGAALLLLLSIAGFAHALLSNKGDKVVLPVKKG